MPIIKATTSTVPVYYTTPHWWHLRDTVLKRDRYRCYYCGERAVTADHVTPRGWGGADHPKNLVACCMVCNAVAGGKRFVSKTAKKRWVNKERRRLTKTEKSRPTFVRSHYEETMRLLRKKKEV